MTDVLGGQRILVTRAKRQAAAFSQAIREKGGIPIETPVMTFQATGSSIPQRLFTSDRYGHLWLVFSSANGVRFFFNKLSEHGIPPHDVLNNRRLAVIGNKTAAVLESYGYQADVVPSSYVAEALSEQLKDRLGTGDEVFVVRGRLSRDVIVRTLTAAGVRVTDWVLYDTVIDESHADTLADPTFLQSIDIVTFMSSSAVDFFMTLIGVQQQKQLSQYVKTACIGPITADTLQTYHVTADMVATTYATDGLLDAMCSS